MFKCILDLDLELHSTIKRKSKVGMQVGTYRQNENEI